MRIKPPSPKISYQFAPVSVAVINDCRISDGAVRAFCVMLSLRDGDGCVIGERRLARRLHRAARTAHTYLHELIAAGYIKPVAGKRRGQRGSYRFTELSAANGFSTPGKRRSEAQQSTATSAAIGFSTVQQSASARIRENYSRTGDDLKNDGATDLTLGVIADLLRTCPLKGRTAEDEARRLDERLPRMRSYLLGHLKFALSEKLEDPIGYAERQTQYGAIPLPSGESVLP